MVEERLRASTQRSALAAVSDAVRLVLFHYVAEGERARECYRLTSTVPALRERELLGGARYQQLFRQYISAWAPFEDEAELHPELMAASVVAAHNRVLRRWLRRQCPDPQFEIDAALETVRTMFDPRRVDAEPIVIVVPETLSMDAVSSRISAWAADRG